MDTILQWLFPRQFINQTCKSNSALTSTAMRSDVVTAQFGGYLLNLCCNKHPLSTTGQRSERHWVSLATKPPAFAPSAGFCTSFNTKNYMIEITVVDRNFNRLPRVCFVYEWVLFAPTTSYQSLLFGHFWVLEDAQVSPGSSWVWSLLWLPHRTRVGGRACFNLPQN